MDANTGLTVLGTAIGSAKIVEKILGPTADYLGNGLKSWTEKRLNNVARIFNHAEIKLGDKIDEEGVVPPKVLRKVIDEGSFCDDELTTEYFGGVLASSRSQTTRDDRGASFANLVSQLTTYEIRSHFLFYHYVKTIFDGKPTTVNTGTGRLKLTTFIPIDSYMAGMEFSPAENTRVILDHVLFGLAKEDLVFDDIVCGGKESLSKVYSPITGTGIVFSPSVLGVELFFWAHGMGDLPVSLFLNRDLRFISETPIAFVPGFRAVQKKRKKTVTKSK